MVLYQLQNTTTTFAFGVPNIKVEDNKGLFAKIR